MTEMWQGVEKVPNISGLKDVVKGGLEGKIQKGTVGLIQSTHRERERRKERFVKRFSSLNISAQSFRIP